MADLPASELRAIARAVSGRDWGRPLDAGNRAGPRRPLDALVGGAFLVVPRPDVLVVDCDVAPDPSGATRDAVLAAPSSGEDGPSSPAGAPGVSTETSPPSAAQRRIQALKALEEALGAVGITPVVVASGRPGHRHLFASVGPPGRHRTAIERWCREAGLDVRTNGVRPPGSPHRSGLEVRVLAPERSVLLEALAPRRSTADLGAVCDALGTAVLSVRMWTTLRTGHAATGYPSASEARMALAVAAGAAGYGPEWLASVLADEANALGETWRARGASWQARELARLWTKAAAWREAHPRPAPFRTRADALAALEDWRAALADAPWPGMGGATDLAVAEALGLLARRGGGVVFVAPLTEIALGAGVSRCTARRSLRRLCTAGWLRQERRPSPTTATLWRLLVPPGRTPTPTRATDPGEEDDISDLGADLARWQGIGKSAARVLRELSGEPLHPVALASRLSSSVNAVSLLCRRLARLGLAERHRGGWVRGRSSPAAIAHLLGVAGRRAADAACYAAECLARRRQRETLRARAQAMRRMTVPAMRPAAPTSAAPGGPQRASRPGPVPLALGPPS